MDDALRMRGGECLGDLDGCAQGLCERYRPFAQPRRQRLAVEILHDEEVDPVVVPHLVQRADARMRESSDRPRFVREARPTARVGRGVRQQHLDRDVAIEPGVAGLVDLAHAASADKALDLEDAQAQTRHQASGRMRCRVDHHIADGKRPVGQKPRGFVVCRQQ